jgi:flagella basal body P-ring formation protein FlgA
MVTAEDLAWLHVREMPREAALEQPDQAIGKEATRPLRAGEPISDADVRVVPLVRSGDIVTIYSRQRGIVARIEAKATGNGALGDLVEFSTLDRREKLRAQVTGFHEAEVLADNPPTGNFNGAGGIRVILQDNK